MALLLDDVIEWLAALHRVMAENKELLTDLDAAIGDADHGINMNRGFEAVASELENNPPSDIGAAFKAVAMTLIRTVGGAAGPLYGTFFLRASSTCSGKTELSAAGVVDVFDAGVMGVQQRGKADLNDKTMLDALLPALQAMKGALARGADLAELLQEGASAARAGMDNTVPLQARKGRASYLGERSIGHQDPGATSAYLLIKTASLTWG